MELAIGIVVVVGIILLLGRLADWPTGLRKGRSFSGSCFISWLAV